MPKRSHVHLAAILVVVMSCWSQTVLAIPSTVKEISESHGSHVEAPDSEEAEASWGRSSHARVDDRQEGSVCHDVISADEFLDVIKRLLATDDDDEDTRQLATISHNRSFKKPIDRSRTKFSRLSFTPNDVIKIRQQLRQYKALTSSADAASVIGMKAGSASDGGDKGQKARAEFQVAGPFTEKDLKNVLRERGGGGGRRKGSRATIDGDGDNSNVMKTRQRQPANTSPLGDRSTSRQHSTPPIKDIALVVRDGRRAVHSEAIVFSPGMNVNNALTQAAILFDTDAASDVNPFECDVTRSRSLLCYVIKNCAGNIVDQWHHWNIEVKDARGEVVSRGVCMPSSPLMPGYSVDIFYVSTQSV